MDRKEAVCGPPHEADGAGTRQHSWQTRTYVSVGVRTHRREAAVLSAPKEQLRRTSTNLDSAAGGLAKGYTVRHPNDWHVLEDANGALYINSPAGDRYAAGPVNNVVTPGSSHDGADWSRASEAMYAVLGRDTRLLSEEVVEGRGSMTEVIRATIGEPDLSVGIALSIQTHGSLVNCNPTSTPSSPTAACDRLARYCARNPVSLERMTYDPDSSAVHYNSDKRTGPTVGTHTFEALDFIALLVAHIPNKGQVMQRYYGYYSNRQRGARRKAAKASAAPATGGGDTGASDSATADATPTASRRQARHRWAELVRRIYEVDPLTCPACGTEMRIVAAILEPKVIDRILAHIRDKGRDARAGPWAAGLADSHPAA